MAVAQGAVDVEEIRAHLLHERADGALGHRELIDVRRAIVAVMSEEVRRINPALGLATAGGITRQPLDGPHGAHDLLPSRSFNR
jgi:hypothetical protein